MYLKYVLRPVLHMVTITIWSTGRKVYFEYICLVNFDMSQVSVHMTDSNKFPYEASCLHKHLPNKEFCFESVTCTDCAKSQVLLDGQMMIIEPSTG